MMRNPQQPTVKQPTTEEHDKPADISEMALAAAFSPSSESSKWMKQ